MARDPVTPSEKIDQLIAGITDWRGKVFATIRKTVLSTDPEIVEEFKWRGTPTWSRDGLIAVCNAHKGKVKITFHSGAQLPDPDKVFNADLEGGKWRAIDYFEGDKVDTKTLKTLVRAAIVHNHTRLKKNVRKAAPKKAPAKRKRA